MVDEKKLAAARAVYNDLCAMIKERNWSFETDEENLTIHMTVMGEDIPMYLVLAVDVPLQMIRLLSPLPFKMCEDKRVEGAIATCVANYDMADGSFDYYLEDGTIAFRMTASFRESKIESALFQYLIDCSCAMVDHYNDKFLAINKGLVSISDFVENR